MSRSFSRSHRPVRLATAFAVATFLSVLTSVPRAQTPHKDDQKPSSLLFQDPDEALAEAVPSWEYVSVEGADPSRPADLIHSVTPITIPATGTAGISNPYPANVVVSGFQGTIGSLSVRLNNLSHTFPADLRIVLVGPAGQTVTLLNNQGGGTDIVEGSLTFTDGAPLPAAALATGTFRPSTASPSNLPAPAPAGPYGTTLSGFAGSSPNGTWSLYVLDAVTADVGTLFGFTLIITPQFNNSTPTPVPPTGTAGTTESALVVSGLTAPITKVTASVHLTHTFDADLDLLLISPDGTIVPLAQNRGGGGDNYGTSCGARTVFDDAAGTPISAGAPPFVGTFRPETPLSAFNGKAGAAANGTWTLRIVDEVGGDAGILQCWSLVITQDDNSLVQPPTGLRVTSVTGNDVTFRWTPPAGGPAPTGYVLEGGVNPGEVLASIPTGSASPIYTINAPTGAFYVRMRSAAAGAVSGNSNEIRIFVNVPIAPTPPAFLQRVITASSLGLSWRNTYEGGAPTSFLLDVTGAAAVSLPLGFSDHISFDGVPPGTYQLSLRAVNAGGVSAPSNPVGVTFPEAGCVFAPSTPTRLLGYRIGNTVFVTWEPVDHTGVAAATLYTLNVTGAYVGSFNTPGRVLSGTVGSGSYGLSVTALNPCGASAPTPVQVVTVP